MLYTPLKSNIYLSGISCISCKEIAFLTIINLKNANFSRSSLFFINFCSHARGIKSKEVAIKN